MLGLHLGSEYSVSQNRCNPLIWLLFIVKTSSNAVIWNTSCKKCILSAGDIKSMGFFYCYDINYLDMQSFLVFLVLVIKWCNGYSRREWTRWHEFKSWIALITFHIALIPSGNVWIQLFSLQLWVNSRTDWILHPWWGN